jgi:uncharacterized membrane protein YesL
VFNSENNVIKKVIELTSHMVLLNFMFILFSVPIVTIGASWNALYCGIRCYVRGEKWLPGFWQGFKRHFWRNTIAWVPLCGIIGFMAWNLSWTWSNLHIPALIINCLIILVIMMLAAALPLVNAYLPGDVGKWLQDASTLVFSAPLCLAVVAVMSWLPVYIALYWPVDVFLFLLVFILVYFSLTALIGTLLSRKQLVQMRRKELEEAGIDPDEDDDAV